MKNIVSLYRETASAAGKLVKFRHDDENSVKLKKILLPETGPVEGFHSEL